jgi:predicted unusual protein kinase regulating ubiquinone biosynthesis (AarF/ABC1/UbiB family)
MALFDVQHRHQIYGAPDFMMAIVALLTYEGIVKRVQPDLDFQALAREMLPRARALALSRLSASPSLAILVAAR